MGKTKEKKISIMNGITNSESMDPVSYKKTILQKSITEKDIDKFNSQIISTTDHILTKLIPELNVEETLNILDFLFEVITKGDKSITAQLKWIKMILKVHEKEMLKYDWVTKKLTLFKLNSQTRADTYTCLSKLETKFDLILAQRKLRKVHNDTKEEVRRKRYIQDNENEEQKESESENEDEHYQNWNEHDLLEGFSGSEYESMSDTAPDVKHKKRFRKEDSDEE